MYQGARELNPSRSVAAIKVLAEFMSGATLEELPPFLSSENPVTRELASRRLQECLDSMSTEELPKFLADTDPLVRGVAGNLLKKSQELEELKGGGNK